MGQIIRYDGQMQKEVTMFIKSQFQTLFAYHWHTNRRLMECAAKLSEADYIANPGYGHGSIHDLLFHLLRTDQGWRLGLETGRQVSPLRQEDFPNLESLQIGFESEQLAWQALLDTLGEEEIEGDINLTTWRGDVMTFPRWRILQHLVLHGMQHHSELAQLLTAKGQSPGNIDFIFFTY
jgi:uncharacterized damage-inducible protein DinB